MIEDNSNLLLSMLGNSNLVGKVLVRMSFLDNMFHFYKVEDRQRQLDRNDPLDSLCSHSNLTLQY